MFVFKILIHPDSISLFKRLLLFLFAKWLWSAWRLNENFKPLNFCILNFSIALALFSSRFFRMECNFSTAFPFFEIQVSNFWNLIRSCEEWFFEQVSSKNFINKFIACKLQGCHSAKIISWKFFKTIASTLPAFIKTFVHIKFCKSREHKR